MIVEQLYFECFSRHSVAGAADTQWFDNSDFKNDYGVQITKPDPGRVNGDYNYNGLVDSADFTVWRDRLGMASVHMSADGNEILSIVVDNGVDQSATSWNFTPSVNCIPAVTSSRSLAALRSVHRQLAESISWRTVAEQATRHLLIWVRLCRRRTVCESRCHSQILMPLMTRRWRSENSTSPSM